MILRREVCETYILFPLSSLFVYFHTSCHDGVLHLAVTSVAARRESSRVDASFISALKSRDAPQFHFGLKLIWSRLCLKSR